MLKIMGKKMFTIYIENCCLSKPMITSAISTPTSHLGSGTRETHLFRKWACRNAYQIEVNEEY